MNPDEIKLNATTNLFAYEKISREIETCNDPKVLKNMLRSYVKLYLKQTETIRAIANMQVDDKT